MWSRILNMVPSYGLHIHLIRSQLFCLLRWKGEGAGFSFFTLFPMCPNYFRNKFSSSFQYLPLVPNVFPNSFPIASDFYCICFAKCCPPFNYIGGPKGRNSIL
jgi:hypothetical protein